MTKIFQWDEKLVQIMQQEIKAKNERIHDRGLIKEFFKFPETIKPSSYTSSNQQMATRCGRYYKLIVSEISKVPLDSKFWKESVTEAEIKLTKMLFYHGDSDIAIITSELGDLHLSSLGMTQVPRYDEEHFSNPVSHFSELECFRRAEQNIEDDPVLKQKLEEMEQTLESSNNWTEQQLSNQFRLPNVSLFRFNTGACLGYDWQVQQFCNEPAVKDTHKCVKHTNEGQDLKLIREIGSLVTKRGFSIVKVKLFNKKGHIKMYGLGCGSYSYWARKTGQNCRICSIS